MKFHTSLGFSSESQCDQQLGHPASEDIYQILLLIHIHDMFREADGEWEEEEKLEAHSDWVRDVAWAPNIGLPTSKIASCSQVREHVHIIL